MNTNGHSDPTTPHTTLRYLRGGRIELTASVTRWLEKPRRNFDGDENLPIEPFQLRSPLRSSCRARIGYEGVLVIRTSVAPNDIRADDDKMAAYLYADPDGVPGNNSYHNIRRLHGWRGTSNDIYIEAYGWRRVESVRTYRDGRAWRVVLSADLRPDEK